MVLSNVIVNITIIRRSFVFGQSRAKVSTGFTNASIAWQSQHLILYNAPCLSFGLSFSMTLVSGRHEVVIGLCVTRILPCSIRAMVSEVPLMYSIVAVVTEPELTLV